MRQGHERLHGDCMTGKRWRFSFWPMLAFAIVLPALIGLGLWQLGRGAEKAALHERFASGQGAEVKDAMLDLAAFDELELFTQVRLRGEFLQDRDVLLDHMPREGAPGHHVLTPFRPEGKNYVVMVDRGWRPGIATGANAPAPAPDNVNEVSGLLAQFPRPALLLEGAPVPEGWPKPMQFPQPADLEQVLGMPVAAHRLLLAESAPYGFRREWQPPGFPPARHYAYAFQWFTLALALTVIAVVLAWPRERKKGEDK